MFLDTPGVRQKALPLDSAKGLSLSPARRLKALILAWRLSSDLDANQTPVQQAGKENPSSASLVEKKHSSAS